MVFSLPIDPHSPTIMAMDLDRLLTRLGARIMDPNNRRLKHDGFERTKTSYVSHPQKVVDRFPSVHTPPRISTKP